MQHLLHSLAACATCHGSDDLHRTDPKQFAMARKPDAALCVSCHTPEMDPHFDFDAYLARVRH